MQISHGYGIDMGAGCVKIYDLKTEKILSEPNRAALRNEEQVLAVGEEAAAMEEKTPSDIRVITPIQQGRISDVMLMEAVLHTLLSKCRSRVGFSPTLLFSVPLDMSEIERRAYYSITHKGRLKRSRILFLERPVADLLGAEGESTKERLIVNIGAECTEISVLSGTHILLSRLLPGGGNSLNHAIAETIRRRHQLLVSARVAEDLKIRLANFLGEKDVMTETAGIDASGGLPRSGMIPQTSVNDAAKEAFTSILSDVQSALERTPPQIQSVVRSEGILLAGGCACIPGAAELMSETLHCPVSRVKNPETNTVRGLARVLKQEKYRDLAFGLAR